MTNASSSVSRYYLQRRHFVCEIAEGGVVLDLPGNRYIGLTRSQMQALSGRVRGWPCTSVREADSVEDVEDVARAFCDNGVLTTDPSVGKDATPIGLPSPTPLVDFVPTTRPRHVASHLATMARCCATSLALLKGRSLDYAVRRVEQRRRTHMGVLSRFDWEATRELTQVFYWLTPLFYTARDHCLYDSLVLIEFLACHGLYPTWVIGVKAFAPFSAHSWIQHETYVLTWSADSLTKFVPILAA